MARDPIGFHRPDRPDNVPDLGGSAMKVRFWGTRGSIAKAGPTTLRYGGNTSCVEVRTASGAVLVLDIGTGAHGLGLALAREPAVARRGHVLISHTHWDHIQGLPFFAPLFVPGNEWHIYGPQGLGPSLREVLAGQMEYTYFPITPAEFAADLAYHDLVEGSFEFDDIRVTTQYLNHPALTLAYRIEADGATLVYATDHEPHLHRLADGGVPPPGGEDERHGRFLADADLVVHDTQYAAEEYPRLRGWGHSTVEYAVDLARAGAVRRLAMFHHDPKRDDDAVDQLVARARARARGDAMDVFAAAEGLLVDLPPRRAAARAPAPTPSPQTAGPCHDVVLVAVADPAIAAALRTAAAADDLCVHAATDTAAALQAIRDVRPALVFADRDLAGGGGAALCRAVRADPTAYGAGLPFVLVTDAAGVEPSMAADVGATDWLATPFSTFYARTRIRAWCLRSACRWRPAALPADEPARLAALRRLSLRPDPEERFDRHVRIAAALFDVPIAAIHLVADDHQWTKASHGCAFAPAPRDISLCAHAILGPALLEVSDVWSSEHADNLALRADRTLRYYAGLPLAAPDGSRVGTLCLVDARPRRLDDRQRGLLVDLGRLIERELASPAAA
jgi:phosphoribosyl 1,2-cyclic phosphodiesterase/CheY-like chemotaxis protein